MLLRKHYIIHSIPANYDYSHKLLKKQSYCIEYYLHFALALFYLRRLPMTTIILFFG